MGLKSVRSCQSLGGLTILQELLLGIQSSCTCLGVCLIQLGLSLSWQADLNLWASWWIQSCRNVLLCPNPDCPPLNVGSSFLSLSPRSTHSLWYTIFKDSLQTLNLKQSTHPYSTQSYRIPPPKNIIGASFRVAITQDGVSGLCHEWLLRASTIEKTRLFLSRSSTPTANHVTYLLIRASTLALHCL